MNNFESLLFYLICFSLSALLMYYGNKRNSKFVIGLSLGIPILIGGLRYGVGTDYPSYVAMYNDLSNLSFADFFSNIFSQIEVGFFILIKLSEFITGNYVFLFASSSLLTIIFFYLGLKRYAVKYPALVYLLFLLIIFPVTFNAVRQGVAMSICFYALSFVMKRDFRRYFIWIVVASLFHTTSLLLLPVYLLNGIIKKSSRNYDIKFYIKLGVIFLSMYLLLPFLFNLIVSNNLFDRYDKYIILKGSVDKYAFYIKLIIVTTILLFSKKIFAKKDRQTYYFFLLFTVLDLVFSTLGFSSTFIARIGWYFSFFNLILLTYLINIFSDKLGKTTVYFILIMYGLTYFFLFYFILGQSQIIPYVMIPGGNL